MQFHTHAPLMCPTLLFYSVKLMPDNLLLTKGECCRWMGYYNLLHAQWHSQPDNLVMLCKYHTLSLFISLEINCFHGLKHRNICIAWPNFRAGYATVHAVIYNRHYKLSMNRYSVNVFYCNWSWFLGIQWDNCSSQKIWH